MPRVQSFRAAKSLAQELIKESGNIHSVTIVPPDDVDENTDEDEVDDDVVGAQIVSGDVAGSYEVNYVGNFNEDNDRRDPQPARWREINENVTCTLQKEEFDEKKAREILMSLPSDDPVDLFQLFLMTVYLKS